MIPVPGSPGQMPSSQITQAFTIAVVLLNPLERVEPPVRLVADEQHALAECREPRLRVVELVHELEDERAQRVHFAVQRDARADAAVMLSVDELTEAHRAPHEGHAAASGRDGGEGHR